MNTMRLIKQLRRSIGLEPTGFADFALPAVGILALGALAGAGTAILTLGVLKGVCAARSELPVSYVNAPQLAAERSISWSESSSMHSEEFVSLISVRSAHHTVSGTLASVGARTEGRIVAVDGHNVEVPPAANMLVVRNDDRPGMIGQVGTVLGLAGVSISSMAVGPSPTEGTALMVLTCEARPSDEVVKQLRGAEGILDLYRVEL